MLLPDRARPAPLIQHMSPIFFDILPHFPNSSEIQTPEMHKGAREALSPYKTRSHGTTYVGTHLLCQSCPLRVLVRRPGVATLQVKAFFKQLEKKESSLWWLARRRERKTTVKKPDVLMPPGWRYER